METLLVKYGYFLLFIGIAVEGEAFLLAGPFLAHRGYFSLWLVILVAIASNCVADLVYFVLARRKEAAWYVASVALVTSLLLHITRAFDLHHSLIAGLLPAYLVYFRRRFHARSDPVSVKQGLAAVRGILALGLPDLNELGWNWRDFTIWITKKTPGEPSFVVSDIISKVSPVPPAEIHSTHAEFLALDKARALIALAGEPKRQWVIEAANHRFSDARDELDRRLLEALDWIKALR